jgi:hypothetical protein
MAVVSIAAALTGSLSPGLAFAAEGCPFLTNADVEEVTARELLFELTSAPMPDGPGNFCDSGIVRVMLLTGDEAGTRWDGFLKGARRDKEQRFPVGDLGGDAYALRLDPRTDNEYPTALIVVTSASYLLAVSVRAENGEAAATVEPQALELTKRAIAQVH